MTASARPVGVIGLGIMGAAVGKNLCKAGVAVAGYDPDPARVALASAAGIKPCASVAAVAARSEILLTSLPSDAALEAVVHDLISARTAFAGGAVLAELSTLSLDCKSRCRDLLRSRGWGMLDCPISGTGAQAELGDLVVYVSGERGDYDAVAPVLEMFARSAPLVGRFGDGMRIKLVANLLVAIHNVASAEALDLAVRAGLDPAQTLELLKSGAASSRILELRGPLMVRASYEPATMKLGMWQKDLDLISGFAESCAAPVNLFRSTLASYAAALDEGRAQQDTAAVFEVLRKS